MYLNFPYQRVLDVKTPSWSYKKVIKGTHECATRLPVLVIPFIGIMQSLCNKSKQLYTHFTPKSKINTLSHLLEKLTISPVNSQFLFALMLVVKKKIKSNKIDVNNKSLNITIFAWIVSVFCIIADTFQRWLQGQAFQNRQKVLSSEGKAQI